MKPAIDIKFHIPLVREGQMLRTMGFTWGEEAEEKLGAQGKQCSPAVVAVTHLLPKQSDYSIKKGATVNVGEIQSLSFM